MTETSSSSPEIIRLQLRKPKSWNWKLSTSKSSPSIILPTIQLYNYKDQLLLETKDNDEIQRSIWRSCKIGEKKLPMKKEPHEYFARHLQRCKSDILSYDSNGMQLCSNGNAYRNTLQMFPEFLQNLEVYRYRRLKSDDVFRRKLKFNEESIKRAELDGYRNFIAPNIRDKLPEKLKINTEVLMIEDNVLSENNSSKIEVNEYKPNKYKTRTSSAGTLIISDESFTTYRHRHRRDVMYGNENLDFSLQKKVIERQIGDLTLRKTEKSTFCQRLNTGKCLKKENIREQYDSETKQQNLLAKLFYSHSDVSPLRNILNDKIEETFDNKSNYNALITSKSRECGGSIIEKLNRKKQGKVYRTKNDGSTSSRTNEKGNRTKGLLIIDHSIERNGGSQDKHLPQLTRYLSPNDHVKMGANVSRHSAKGLSGRRSQSSGSICNGKGRHTDGKICSSLPSYLDDREANGYNNNHHDCEKAPFDEVDRIPPLGEGAPLHWKFSDTQTVLCDQGYGSERSPEEEYPPPLPDHHLEPHACYPFVTPDSTFIVKLTKGSRGLGLSVTGGIDSSGSWPGLIRIKRLFPHQPASVCGILNVGDLLLEVNSIALTGLTNYEALEVLRTAPNQVDLKVCRPPPDVLNCVSPISEVPPPPPRREPPNSLNLPSVIYGTPEEDCYHGEFEITLKKIQGSLGFTLRKEDESALGHYIRALVREPALTDGRIRAGDKIIAVNDVEISALSHEDAVQFLRQCSETVRLRLYRDSAQTPIALSPTETTPRTSFSRKAYLRQEAVDMLKDIAIRKLIPSDQDIYRRSLSPNVSPRRQPHQPYRSEGSQIIDSSTKYISDEQFHEGLFQKCSHPYDDEAFNSLFSIESDDGDRPSRPSSLDLYNPNQTPIAARKPRFNFSLAHNAYELNNLDPDVLDAPNLTYNIGTDDIKSTEVECGDSFPKEPASMPHIAIENSSTFNYKNPAYQSAHPQIGNEATEPTITAKITVKPDDAMAKWKNAVLQSEIEDNSTNGTNQIPMKEEYEVLAIELNRGWNSRLGFSLQGAAGVTYVSAVHADSVAAKDGRIKPGDRVIKVNDESVEHLTTSEIIDLLRIVRGPVCIIVSRIKSTEDCPKSNAEN